MKELFITLLAVLLALSPLSLPGARAEAAVGPARYVSDPRQLETIASLTAVNDGHTFYTLEYTADYRLDELLAADASSMDELTAWMSTRLLDGGAGTAQPGGGCSAFLASNRDGQPIYGRNYDFVQNAQNVLVHCAPEGGYASVAIAAGGWVFDSQLDDGSTDLSMLVALPYLMMDGMNEKGFVISVLKLDGEGTAQWAEGKHSVVTTVAMRLALDRAATVEEALNLFAAYNQYSAMPTANFHFFLADAAGHYCILEYAPGDNGALAKGWFDASLIADESFRAGCDGSDEEGRYRMVTNLYTLFTAKEYGYDDGQHGLDRYQLLSRKLKTASYRLDESLAMALLSDVYQDFGATSTHETQWSVVYNPVAMTADICPRVNQSDKKAEFYQTEYRFELKDVFGGAGKLVCEAQTPSGV